ncbi:variable large family protein (plasmid) [Borrelia parkeri]|nr:variable large family protein [Borrelia parkeri]
MKKCLLSIFISFSDMFIDVLDINYDSKKEYIGKYFTKIA